MKRAAAKKAQAAEPPAPGPSMETPVEGPAGGGGDASSRPRAERPVVSIRLGGKDYRLRSDASEESLQQVAGYVDHAMQKIRERTDTVDSQDIALLASLNLAREVLHLREQVEAGGGGTGERLRSLIERVEAALPADRA